MAGPALRIIKPTGVTLASGLLILAATISCTLGAGGPEATPPASPSPTADLTAELPFEGVWWTQDGKVLVLTPTTFYSHENESDYDRQVLGEIQAYDLAQGTVEYRMELILINGEPGGFDSPMKLLTFAREGDTLRVSTGDAGFPAVLEETYTRR